MLYELYVAAKAQLFWERQLLLVENFVGAVDAGGKATCGRVPVHRLQRIVSTVQQQNSRARWGDAFCVCAVVATGSRGIWSSHSQRLADGYLFPDGTECEEWAFFRGECEPGQFKTTDYE